MTLPDSRIGRGGERVPDARRPASFPSLPLMDRMTTIRRPGSLPQGIGCGMKPTKLLLRVTVQRNLWPVHVMISPESTVVDLIKATVEAYLKEGRRPLLVERDPLAFELHFSQFSLESLSREEKVINLGSRNFFLCLKPSEAAPSGDCRADEAENESSKFLLPLPRFISIALRL